MAESADNKNLIYLYHDVLGHRHELQLSLAAASLPELQAYCLRKNQFRRGGALQGRLVLRVPQRSVDASRALWKKSGHSIHADHRSLFTANLRFFHEVSVECLAEGESHRLEVDGGVCRLLLPPTAFEDFFAFLCHFAEGHWAYRFDVDDALQVSTHIPDPTPEQKELWNEDI